MNVAMNRLAVFFIMVSHAAHALEPSIDLSCRQILEAGEVTYREEETFYEVDEQTERDLSLHKKILPLLNRSKTQFGLARLKWLLTHPYLDPVHIQERLHASQALTEEALFSDVSKSLEQIHWALQPSLEASWLDMVDHAKPIPHWPAAFAAAGARAPFALAWRLYQMGEGGSAFLSGAFGALMLFGNIAFYESKRLVLERHFRNLFDQLHLLIPKLNGTGSPQLLKIAKAFSRIEDASRDPELTSLRSKLNGMARQDSVQSLLRYPLEVAIVYSQWTMPPVQAALARARRSILEVASAIGELDFFLQMAHLKRSSTVYQFGQVLTQSPAELYVEQGHHPYLHHRNPELSTPNDVHLFRNRRDVGPHRTMVAVTGPHKRGKSVYLRKAGLASIMTQMGAPFPGKVRLTPLRVYSRMRIIDDEDRGESTFSEDAMRAGEIHRACEREGTAPYLILADEMLRGAASENADVGEQVLLEAWSRMGGLVLVATHNRQISAMAQRNPHMANLHVEDAGTNHPDYRVLPGPSVSENALDLLELHGIPEHLIQRMRDLRRARELGLPDPG